MPRASLTLRLTLLFGAGTTAVLIVLGYMVVAQVQAHFVEQDRMELSGKIELVRNILAKVRASADFDSLSGRMNDALTGHHHLSVLITAPDGRMLYSTTQAPFPEVTFPLRLAAPAESPELATWLDAGRSFRGAVARVPIVSGEMSHADVAVALNIDHHVEFLRVFNRNLWLSIAVCAFIAGVLGWVAARKGLAPVRDMAAVATNISASRLHDRLLVETLPPELVDLGTSFNEMLARLEESFSRLSDFSSDLAHELQTPLANVMTQTQVALSRTRTAEEYREVLYSGLEECDRLARTVADMLFLAKADHGLILPTVETVDIAAEVHGLFDYYDALVEDRAITLACTGEGKWTGDRLMIRRALNNLLANAITHSPGDGRVDVRIGTPESRMTAVVVENRGDTIPPEHLPRIFDRFHRVDPARQRSSGGAGLGLAITKSIVAAHGGTIQAMSANGVTTFEMRLPSAAVR